MKNLLIDIGNSRCKWVWQDNDLSATVENVACEDISDDLLVSKWGKMAAPARILVSNVANGTLSDLIHNWCLQNWQLTPERARVSDTFAGVRCAYSNINQLGVDRWLAVIAAWHRYQEACLVVDCGTATTIDAIDATGQHLGGLILPGRTMMHKSLIQGTVGIDSDAFKSREIFARDTGNAVSNGCMLASTSCIEHAAAYFRDQQDGNINFLITGGAAGELLSCLSSEFILLESLVLDGLAIMAKQQ